jgi:hypothetical protein
MNEYKYNAFVLLYSDIVIFFDYSIIFLCSSFVIAKGLLLSLILYYPVFRIVGSNSSKTHS